MKFFLTFACCCFLAISMVHSALADGSSGLSCAVGTKGNPSCVLSCKLQGCDVGNCNADGACACSGCKVSVPEKLADCEPTCRAECTQQHCGGFMCNDAVCICFNCPAEEFSLRIGTAYNKAPTHPKFISSNKITV
ncbi:hypothetical protein WR25_24546 [Diploscapter pachys]|uniref:Antistasin-like domain-containing protein n=1 Tax=Diploscapter pachys TaxID=2018661 RepID=A0A2A2JNX4_9BILA|nr:hypothetical protein WR25_24546 [Diploscapter pachys]